MFSVFVTASLLFGGENPTSTTVSKLSLFINYQDTTVPLSGSRTSSLELLHGACRRHTGTLGSPGRFPSHVQTRTLTPVETLPESDTVLCFQVLQKLIGGIQ